MLRIGNVDFPHHVFTSSGTRGIAGEGYPYHRWFPWSRVDFCQTTLVTKTITLTERKGNMPLTSDGFTPADIVPRCIIPFPRTGDVLNAVNLSNKGIEWYLPTLQKIERPFVLSFMAVSETPETRLAEWREFLLIVQTQKLNFAAPFIIELNVSCPNTGHDTTRLAEEVEAMLSVPGLQTPVMVNINLLVPPETAVRISQHENCSAISQCNSIPWGQLPEYIDWKKRFGSDISPLVKRGFGPGGYSGPLALPPLLEFLREIRYRIQKPVIAGSGIRSANDADQVIRVGDPTLAGLKIGTVAMMRPWEVDGIVKAGNARYIRHWRMT